MEAFDEGAGLGTVHAGDGGLYPFHCTQVVDGSRTVEVGAEVEFTLCAGHRGTWEARAIAPAMLPSAD